MAISNLGIMKGGSRDYFFVLTSETLSWYTKNDVRLLASTLIISFQLVNHFINVDPFFFGSLLGERQEVHAAAGRAETARH